jgi:hypothetical protein
MYDTSTWSFRAYSMIDGLNGPNISPWISNLDGTGAILSGDGSVFGVTDYCEWMQDELKWRGDWERSLRGRRGKEGKKKEIGGKQTDVSFDVSMLFHLYNSYIIF